MCVMSVKHRRFPVAELKALGWSDELIEAALAVAGSIPRSPRAVKSVKLGARRVTYVSSKIDLSDVPPVGGTTLRF